MDIATASAHERRVLVLAPVGRDASVVLMVLDAAGYKAEPCETLTLFVSNLAQGAGVGIVTEEALRGEELASLNAWMGQQPPWSDFPLVVLATRQAGRRSPQALAMLEGLGNVVLLERPLNAETLVSATRAAWRSRTRQYDARSHLDEQHRVHRENERLFEAESRAARELAVSRDALLAVERDAREQAELASRTKDEFLATLSHELRTPLTAILGWVYLLKARSPTAADLAKGVDVIERNARAQAQLIDELLDMSRIIAGNVRLDLQPVAPAGVVEAAIASIQPSADAKAIVIERSIDPGLRSVFGDSHRLLQIVWNLLSNAVKFTASGGTIKVSMREEDELLRVCIVDDGEGIPPDFLPFIFDRFRQADGSTARRHGGLGLGLSIVRNLVQLHRGSVQVQSEGVGMGASLTVRIPLMSADALQQAALAQPVVSVELPRSGAIGMPALAELQILVVDDEPDSRDMICRILVAQGAHVVVTASAEEAMKAMARAPVDLLISDIGMPSVDGYELLKRLRATGYRIPALALTAFAREDDRSKALAAGFGAHLAKPFDAGELVTSALRLASPSAEAQSVQSVGNVR
jgi:signal transduction histidine kinase/ActR/RegA family two-component response regulator